MMVSTNYDSSMTPTYPSKMKKHSIERMRENIVKIGSQQSQRKRKPGTRGGDSSYPTTNRISYVPGPKSMGAPGQPLSMRNYMKNGITLDNN
jgi:hypothetical protein